MALSGFAGDGTHSSNCCGLGPGVEVAAAWGWAASPELRLQPGTGPGCVLIRTAKKGNLESKTATTWPNP